MTTIVAVRKASQIALAADTLTTFGSTRLASPHDAAPEKILRHGNTYFGIAGSAAHQMVLESLLKNRDKTGDFKFDSRHDIYESFRRMHPLLKEEAYLNPKEEDNDPYESSQMTMLVANASGIYGVYSMREVFEFDRFWSIGSGRDFALGAMFAAYDGKRTARQIAELAVRAGANYDTGTALPLNMTVMKFRG